MRRAFIVCLALAMTAGMCLAAGQAVMTTTAPATGKTWNTKPVKPAVPLPKGSKDIIFSTDFESNNGGFTMASGNGSTADDWSWTTAPAPYSTGSPNGLYWWMVNADAYDGINDEYLYSPVIDCSTYENIQLAWFGCQRFFGTTYYMDVSVTTDGGSNWTSIYNSTSDVSPSAAYGPVSVPGFTGQGSCQVRWHYYDDSWGYGAGVDDVMLTGDLSVSFAHDLAMQSIDVPASHTLEPLVPFAPTVTVKNRGTNAETGYWVYYSIDDGSKAVVYSGSAQEMGTLDPDSSKTYIFPDFTPSAGSYEVTAWVELAGDEFTSNDTLTYDFSCNFMGWTALDPTGSTALQWPGGCIEGGKLYVVGGLSGSPSSVVQVYDPLTKGWSYPTTLPVPVFRPACAVINGKLYAIGGFDGTFAAQPYTQIYDIAGNSWTTGTAPVSARGGSGGGVVDGKMYLVGGAVSSSWPTDCPTWQYDPAADTAGGTPWTQMTDCPRGADGLTLGAPFYGAPGLNRVVAGGDYRGTTSGLNTFYVYDPAADTVSGSPWTTLASGPVNAGGKDPGLIWDNSHIYLFGGDPAGSWSGYSNKTYHYDEIGGAWTDLGILLNSSYEGMVGGIISTKIYSFSGTTGGGPLDPAPFEWTYDLAYAGPGPEITYTNPADAASQTKLLAPIVVAFSQAVDNGTFAYTCTPDPGGWSAAWNAGNDTVTLTHDRFDYGTSYSFEVTAASNPGGSPLEPGASPNPFAFTTWNAPDVVQSQLATPGNAWASQIFEDFADYSCYLADDINLSGMDSVKITAVELVGGAWNGHTWHPIDSLYLSFTTDSLDFPAWSQEIWSGNLLPGAFDDDFDGAANNTFIMYLDPPVILADGKTWMMSSPYMNFSSKDGQWGWAENTAIFGSSPARRNPGGAFGWGTDWFKASVTGMINDGIFRILGYAYPTGVAGGPDVPTRAVFALLPNHPNPARGGTRFNFSLPRDLEFSLGVYNITGQLVQKFAGKGKAGINSLSWNTGRTGAGVYLYRLNAAGQTATRKMIVIN